MITHGPVDIHSSVCAGRDVTVWQFCTICENTELGNDVVVGSGVWIGKHCRIGNNVRIQHGAFIPNGTILEDNVFIGPNVTMTDDKFPRSGNKHYIPLPPVIRFGASIGAGAIILPGVEVGPGTMVGAGAVVTRSVMSDTIIGVPARPMGGGKAA